MSRTSRIPYHQNVYDLLQVEPGECPEAARMIAEHETKHGSLPASVRGWYLVPNIVGLSWEQIQLYEDNSQFIWNRFGGGSYPEPLAETLRDTVWLAMIDFPYVCVVRDNQDYARWWVEIDRSDDPPVFFEYDEEPPTNWTPAGTFREFVQRWIEGYYPVSGRPNVFRTPCTQPHSNGLWLRTPAEPFEPAVIDYLIDHFGEPERTPRPGNVTTYTFRPSGGSIRVTADEPTLGGGLSAWWVHAESPERLAELGRLIVPFGTLGDTLRADTDPALEVLALARSPSGRG